MKNADLEDLQDSLTYVPPSATCGNYNNLKDEMFVIMSADNLCFEAEDPHHLKFDNSENYPTYSIGNEQGKVFKDRTIVKEDPQIRSWNIKIIFRIRR